MGVSTSMEHYGNNSETAVLALDTMNLLTGFLVFMALVLKPNVWKELKEKMCWPTSDVKEKSTDISRVNTSRKNDLNASHSHSKEDSTKTREKASIETKIKQNHSQVFKSMNEDSQGP